MQSTNTGARHNTTRKWCGPFGCFRSSKGTAAAANAAPANATPANAAANAARAASAAAVAAAKAARAARVANAKAARKAQVNAELAEMMAAAAGPGGAAVQGARVPPIEEQLRLLEAEAEANAAARAAVEGEDEEYNALQGELQEQTDKINRISRTLAETRFGGNRKKPSKLRKTRSKKSRRHRR